MTIYNSSDFGFAAQTFCRLCRSPGLDCGCEALPPDTPTPLARVTAAFHRADAIWQAELEAAYGRLWTEARYTKAGHGEPGSPLRAAKEARTIAARNFHAAWEVANRRNGS